MYSINLKMYFPTMLGAPSIFMKLYLKSLYRDNNPFQMTFFVKDLLEVGGII